MNVDHYILCYFNLHIWFSENIILALYVKNFVKLFCCDCHINGLNGNFIDGNEQTSQFGRNVKVWGVKWPK